ncbi:UNKNOWN [Stylonychia lemnae]|uniref:Uncharacterized protein n=1 Tax=Stylonychia lemnae TaxID=5949 RepID=A0A078AXC8_STYLE|nr:UNKNOWN [Stylonychia lemnae]|eukprot:CDW86731.1 UNKNOWN [Stylonychia lemnae]
MVRSQKNNKAKHNEHIEISHDNKPFQNLRAPQECKQNFLARQGEDIAHANLFVSTATASTLDSHHHQLHGDDCEFILPNLDYQGASYNSPRETAPAWIGSQSSLYSSSREHSFEMDAQVQRNLLKAPKLWERVNQTASKTEPELYTSVFPQFAQYEDTESKQAGGMFSLSDGLRADGRLGEIDEGAMPPARLNGGEGFNSRNFKSLTNSNKYSQNQNITYEKDCQLSQKSENNASQGALMNGQMQQQCNEKTGNELNQEVSQQLVEDCFGDEDSDDDDDLIQFSCTPLTLSEAINFESLLQNGSGQPNLYNVPVFGFQSNFNQDQQVHDIPPLCSLQQYLGQALGNIRRERKFSESENSSDNETSFYQEKKNIGFFFRQEQIENHMDETINGSRCGQPLKSQQLLNQNLNCLNINTVEGQQQYCSQEFAMDMDVDMIPDADDLMSALMT